MSTHNTEKNLQSPPSSGPRKSKRKFSLDKKQGAFLLFVLLVCSLPTYFISVQHVQAHEKKILGYSQNSFFVWSENSATKIDPLYKPHADAAMVNNTLWLKGAKGEFESTQLVVRKLNGASLDNLTVSLTPFVDQNGNDAIGVEN